MVNLFSVGNHLVDTKHLASIKMLPDLTYLTYPPDLTIDEKLEREQFSSTEFIPK